MSDLDFFRASAWLPLGVIAAEGLADMPASADAMQMFRRAASLTRSGPNDIAFVFDDADLEDLIATRAGACFVPARLRSKVPMQTVALLTDQPLDAFGRVVRAFQARASLPLASEAGSIDHPSAIHRTARLEHGVKLEPGAVIGAGVQIGAGTRIGPNSAVFAGARIGRNCVIDAHVSIRNALIGDRVLIHAGARIGAGGLDLERTRLARAPRLGRVIIQDDVEIEANVVLECAYADDTLVGEKTRLGAFAFVKGGTTIDRGVTVEAGRFP